MPKILHLITSLETGGAQVALRNFLHHGDRRNFKHHLLFFHDGPMRKQIEALGVQCEQVRGLIHPYDPVGLIHLYRKIRTVKPDLIHASLWSASTMGRLLAPLLHIPIICDVHANVQQYDWFRCMVEKMLYRLGDRYRCVGRVVQQSLQALVKNRCDRAIVLYNGVDVAQLKREAAQASLSRTQIGFGEHDFVIGLVGRLVPLKNFDVVLQAVASIQQREEGALRRCVRVCIVGDGPEHKKLQKLAQTLNIEQQVYFAGNQAQIAPWYQLFDCFVLPSQTEGLSCALLESLALEIPVITTGHDGGHEVVVNGENGYVMSVGDQEELEAWLLRVMVHGFAGLKKSENWSKLAKIHDIKSTTKLLESLYGSTISSYVGPGRGG